MPTPIHPALFAKQEDIEAALADFEQELNARFRVMERVINALIEDIEAISSILNSAGLLAPADEVNVGDDEPEPEGEPGLDWVEPEESPEQEATRLRLEAMEASARANETGVEPEDVPGLNDWEGEGGQGFTDGEVQAYLNADSSGERRG